ncbi:FecR domain-containing protein [Olivibacter sp. SDN3]|uniref:FecR family protein n=1 Tax=Olivibacter sp. SDN3 TaxID=2764720 RepID=UPI001650F82B|nr:FecR family protein [Olivibacter sp. SDN3]QNL51051.1 FecR domain-containing protein [Olivibacter sp. SDN3]
MDSEQLKKLLEKYLSGKCSAEEKLFVDEWFSTSGEKAAHLDEADLKRIEKEMFTHIRGRTFGNNIPVITSVKRFRSWQSIAAAFLLLIGIGYIFFFRKETASVEQVDAIPQLSTFQTKAGQKAKLLLPDSSVIWLNGNSSIRYDQAFRGARREVLLDSGEAFFEIRTDPAKPFIVYADGLRTQVLGTSFNIQMRNHRNQYMLTVNTGKVNVRSKDGRVPLIPVDAGQQFTYNREGGNHSVKHARTTDFSAWKSNEFILKNASWKEIADKLWGWYGISCKLLLTTGDRETFTAKFDNPSLEEVLNALRKINHFNYKIIKKEVIITN